MTILTKPSNEKKPEKEVGGGPITGQDEVAMLPGGALPRRLPLGLTRPRQSDAESLGLNAGPQHSCVKTVLLCLISIVVMLMGMLGGYTLYRMYAPEPHSNMYYRAMCDIPYMSRDNLSLPRVYDQSDFDLSWRRLLPHITDDSLGDGFFREEIELDMSDDESYAKINVPDFKDGRRGRFMHDFKENQSAIIDTTANRCFIMPLDRNTTLPPKSFMDLMQKMGSGYYNVDTDHVRRNMRVVTPPITDLSTISERIANECFDMKIYMLENYVNGIFKREAKPITEAGKFAEFSGKGIVEFDILNIADIEEFESKQLK